MNNKNQKWHTPLINLAIHVVIGSLMFVIIAIPAVGLSFLVTWLETINVAPYTLQLLTLLEHAIVTIDVLSVLAYILTTIYREVKGNETMMNSLMAQIRDTARQDVRLYLAPFVGAVEAVKREINRTSHSSKAKDGVTVGKTKRP